MTTELTDDRDAALRVGYSATDWSAPVPFSVYRNALQSWDIKAIERDGEVIGAVFFRDGEVHASVLPEWRGRWLTRKLLRVMFEADNAWTQVTPGHEYMYDILRRLGLAQNDAGHFVKGH